MVGNEYDWLTVENEYDWSTAETEYNGSTFISLECCQIATYTQQYKDNRKRIFVYKDNM